MTIHISAFTSSIAQNAVQATLAAVNDQSYNVQNSAVFMPENRTMLGAFAGGVAISAAWMKSASLFLNGLPSVTPVHVGAVNGSIGELYWANERGYTLPGLEQISMLVSHSGAGADVLYGALWHANRVTPVPPGKVRTVHATASCAGALGNWFISQLVFDTPLMQGRYAVVGMNVFGANTFAARLQFTNQVDRPGILTTVSASTYWLNFWRNGAMGVLGTFDNYNAPQLECIGSGTIATQDVYLDLMQIS